jgi:hypothetical protein
METGNQEVNLDRKTTKGEKIQIIFLILLCIAVAVLIFAVIEIIKYKNMLQNPLGYNLDKFNLKSCSCLDNSGNINTIYSSSYKPISSNQLNPLNELNVTR